MLTDFNKLPDSSRIWIYSAEKTLTANQQNYILTYIAEDLRVWNAHKAPLKAGLTILENHFIVVALDETVNPASGCSIDTLQQTIQKLEKDLSISLLNRLNVFCRIDDRIHCVPTTKLADYANKETLFYDLTIQKKGDLSNWLKMVEEGWCANLIL